MDLEELLEAAKRIDEHWNPGGGEWIDPKMTVELFDAIEELSYMVEGLRENQNEDKGG